MIVVSNAGPLIALAKIDHFDLLRSVYGHLCIPKAVWDEVVTSGRERAGSYEVQSAAWIEMIDVEDMTAVQILRDRLDFGESQALVLSRCEKLS